MGSYSDFMRNFGITGRTAGYVQDIFNALYDNSHGEKRYWLRNTPWGFIRALEDKAQAAQDRYDNTGTDEAYAFRVDSSALGVGAGIASGMGRLPKMARSLMDVYQAEIMEDVGNNVDMPMYG